LAKNVVLQPNFLYSIGIMPPKCNHKGQIKEKELSGEEMAGVCRIFLHIYWFRDLPTGSALGVFRICNLVEPLGKSGF